MTTAPKRRWFRFSLGTLFALIAAFGLLLRMTDSSCRRLYNGITIGMPADEVEALMGGPGQELAPLTFVDVEFDEQRSNILASWPQTPRHWQCGQHMISVEVGRDNRVAAKYYKRAPNADGLHRLLDRLGL